MSSTAGVKSPTCSSALRAQFESIKMTIHSPGLTTETRTNAQKTAGLRRVLARQLIMEIGLPLAGYYGLRAAGASPWLSLAAGCLLAAPWILYSAIRNRRLDLTAAFSLSLVLASGVMSLVTGDPRLLLVRDSWLGALFGIWILATLMTQRPFVMVTSRAIVVAKVGEAGAKAWEGRWDSEPGFRRHIRILSAVWGAVLLADAGVRVVLAYSLPVDAVPGVSTVQWLVVLGGLLIFHTWYVNRTGLKA
jgi:hypothetical protein